MEWEFLARRLQGKGYAFRSEVGHVCFESASVGFDVPVFLLLNRLFFSALIAEDDLSSNIQTLDEHLRTHSYDPELVNSFAHYDIEKLAYGDVCIEGLDRYHTFENVLIGCSNTKNAILPCYGGPFIDSFSGPATIDSFEVLRGATGIYAELKHA